MPKFKEMIEYSMEEFSRNRNFDRCFPQENNVEYYSKFLSEPAEENIIFWNWYKNKFSISGYDNIIKEVDLNFNN
jgi:ABC-type maltose transport system permease subunit